MNGVEILGLLDFHLGPETRLDHSELLCNKVLLKYKREKASVIDIMGGGKVPPCQFLPRPSYTP